ncbi:MAG: hypothetical protein IPP15_24085 [Saprospiraceae bacterium]|uniref:Uncharacterized protein n=1 Tax=Candidatus Opimibacter skivensis TaxID=2982028 RepID=A0A9D7SYC3_9BACT|nr:hypothetical protein [Candidatus Opimibacter skivensis]
MPDTGIPEWDAGYRTNDAIGMHRIHFSGVRTGRDLSVLLKNEFRKISMC